VYGVIGNSVKLLTIFVTHFSGDDGSALSAKYTFDTHSPTGTFYPLLLRVSGIQKGRPFRGNYRLVFDEKSLKYPAPKNMPDEIKPAASRK
jgi:hypothetical protein